MTDAHTIRNAARCYPDAWRHLSRTYATFDQFYSRGTFDAGAAHRLLLNNVRDACRCASLTASPDVRSDAAGLLLDDWYNAR